MASPNKCDVEGCNNPADVIVSNCNTGDTSYFCTEHYTEFCFAVAKNIADSWEAQNKKAKQPRKPTQSSKTEDSSNSSK